MPKLAVLAKLPVFPAIATRLMRLLYNEKVSFHGVSNLVGSDAALTAEVLRMANSPLVGAVAHISSLNQAMMLLGIERLNALVLTLSLCKFMAPASRCPSLKKCWRHNLAAATIAESVARGFMQSRDTAYTAGILHDVGRLALLVADPKGYDALLHTAEVDSDAMLEKEREMFGADHCEAGRLVVEMWGFPEEFGEYTLYHHRPCEQSRAMTQVVHAGCAVADMLGFQVSGAAPTWNPESIEPPLPRGVLDALDPDGLKWQIADRINGLETAGFAMAEAHAG